MRSDHLGILRTPTRKRDYAHKCALSLAKVVPLPSRTELRQESTTVCTQFKSFVQENSMFFAVQVSPTHGRHCAKLRAYDSSTL